MEHQEHLRSCGLFLGISISTKYVLQMVEILHHFFNIGQFIDLQQPFRVQGSCNTEPVSFLSLLLSSPGSQPLRVFLIDFFRPASVSGGIVESVSQKSTSSTFLFASLRFLDYALSSQEVQNKYLSFVELECGTIICHTNQNKVQRLSCATDEDACWTF